MAIRRDRRKWFRKVLHIAVIAVCVSVLLSLTSAGVFFRCFFGRSELTAQTIELRYADIDRTAYPRQEVSFLSGKNRLRGYFYGTGEQGVVLIVHGMNGGADSHLPEILYFADHGWRVFAFDGTGVRDSEGSGTVSLSQLHNDTLAALEYLSQSEYRALPVVLYGHSAGGYAAATALESEYPVRAAVCISAFNSPVDTMCYHEPERHPPHDLRGEPQRALDRMAHRRSGGISRRGRLRAGGAGGALRRRNSRRRPANLPQLCRRGASL